MPVDRNPYSDPKDPRHAAVEIRRRLEQKGFEIENGRIYDKKTGREMERGNPEPGELNRKRR
jgi:hypothetical protein